MSEFVAQLGRIGDAQARILAAKLNERRAALSVGRTRPRERAAAVEQQQQHAPLPAAARDLEYWRSRLGGAEPLTLPTDRPRTIAPRFARDTREFALDTARLAQLEVACQARGTQLPTVLLAAYKVLLSTYCCQDDITVAVSLASHGSHAPGGLCDNVVLLRTNLAGASHFTDVLRRVAATLEQAKAHQAMPFHCVARDVLGEQSAIPLSRAGFAMPAEPDCVRSPDLVLTILETEAPSTDSDLHLDLTRGADGLRGRITFDSDLFSQATIGRFIDRYVNFLEALDATLEQPLGRLELLDRAEHGRLVTELNATEIRCPPLLPHQQIELQCHATPDRIGVSCGAHNLSYAALNARANRLAGYLRRHAIGPEQVVALYLQRSTDMAVALFGVLKSGAAYLPIDPTLPDVRVAYMLADASAAMVLTEAALASRLAGSAARRIVGLDTEWDRISATDAALPADLLADNPAYVIYTSGSTGNPKPVVISHAGLRNYLFWCERAYPLADGWGAPVQSSLGFDLTVTSMLAPLVAGRRVWLLPETEDGAHAIQNLGDAPPGASVIKLTPSHLMALRHVKPAASIARMTRSFVIGGEALRRDHVEFLRDAYPEVVLINEYGPTETVVGCAVFTVPASGDIQDDLPIGRPIANAQLYVLDRWLRPLPAGIVGELHIGGAGLGRGYLHRGGATADAWRPSPFAAGERLYRTGDFAKQHTNGDLLFLGRRDNQVKLRGYRIELSEIEAAVRRDDAVQDCVVAVWQDAAGERHLVLYVVAAEPPLDLRRLLAGAAACLPNYMVPRLIVPLAQLPVTHNGKVDRAALPPPRENNLVASDDAQVEPRTALERQLAEIWGALLPIARFGVNDNFLELGGESMAALQIIARVQDSLGVELPLSAIFEHPTIARLARCIEDCARSDAPAAGAVIGASRVSGHALSAAQLVCWNQSQSEGASSAHFINPAILEIEGRLDPAVLEQALNALAHRHRVLRSCFALDQGEPRQLYDASLHLPLTTMDLTDVPPAEQRDAVRQVARAELHRPFQCDAGPLLRGTLVRLAPTHHCLVITKHQIVADGWSMAILLRELGLLYDALAAHEPSKLPPVGLEYADYVAWQQAWLASTHPAHDLAYWNSRLAGAQVLEMPLDRPRPVTPRFKGATRHFLIDKVTTKRLQEGSRRHGATLFMTLLTGYKLTLHALSGQDDISVATLIANRTRREFEPLVGLFVNTLVLRTDLARAPDFTDALRRVRQTCLEAYAHQDLPFSRVVSDVLGANPRPPLLRAMFALQTIPMRSVRLREMSMTPLEVDCGTSEVDLYVFFKETSEGLRGWLEFDSDLFDPPSIAGFTDRLTALLATAAL